MSAEPQQGTFDCLHPTIEERGRVKEDGEGTFKVSIQDCLACSGCAITQDEITIISEQNTTKVFEKIGDLTDYVVLVATQCVANLAAVKNWTAQKAFSSIVSLFAQKGARKVVLETEIRNVWRNLLLKEFIEGKAERETFLVSSCAGSVVYYQRKTDFGAYLAQVKPFPQLFANYEKKIAKTASYVLYIGPCYDRKLEAAKLEGEVDAVLTTSEIEPFLEEPTEEISVNFPKGNDVDFLTNSLNELRKSVEAGDVEGKIRTIEPFMNEEEISSLISSLPDKLQQDVTGGSFEGETLNKRLTRVLEMVKSGKKPKNACPHICQIDYCKNGCCAGGGLIRGDTPAARRALIASTQQIHDANANDSGLNRELYAAIIQMGYSIHYESVPQEKATNFDW